MRIIATLVSVLIAGTLSSTIAQESIPSTEQLLQSVPQLSNIPGIENFNTSSIKIEDIEKVLREKCEKNGGATAYITAKDSVGILQTCLQSLGNITQLQSEMKAARPHGELDTVFNKYCQKIPIFKRCMRTFTDSIEPCLEAEERESVKISHNITSSLLEFICHNEGDRIAMFIAAGGVECFKNKTTAVTACANQTFSGYAPAPGASPDVTNFPKLVLGLQECLDLEKFQTCTVKELEQCSDPTPANVFDSLLNFVKRVTPCEEILKGRADTSTGDAPGGSGSVGTTGVFNVLLISTAMLLSLKFA